MTVPFRALVRSGVVVFSGFGAGAAFIVLGIAGVAFRADCEGPAGTCAEAAAIVDPVVTGSTEPDVIVKVKQPSAEFEPIRLAESDVGLEEASGLIESTFALLADPEKIAKVMPEPTEIAAVPVSDSPRGAVAKRVVKSVKLDAMGNPVWPPAPSGAVGGVNNAGGIATAEAAIEAEVPAGGEGRLEVATLAETVEVEPLAFGATGSAANAAATELVAEVAATPDPDNFMVTVDLGPLNVRSGPSTRHRKIASLATSEEVRATGRQGKWVLISDSDGVEGWVFADHLKSADFSILPETAEEIEVASVEPEAATVEETAAEPEVEVAAAPASSDGARVKGQGVNVRSGPSTGSGKLFALVGGTEVTITDRSKGWLKITDDRGRSGWAYSSFLAE